MAVTKIHRYRVGEQRASAILRAPVSRYSSIHLATASSPPLSPGHPAAVLIPSAASSQKPVNPCEMVPGLKVCRTTNVFCCMS